ncbi:multidrug effflux MFS transporter [Neptunicella sp. SCSIO 80796]|uniref:multidrug effflux MFS transporter n=1 Tax=Neptunicella plasticusilytica TaxID=3117012 RepID=UPI003A4D84C9
MSNTPELNCKPAMGLAEFVTLMAFMTSLVALSIDAMLPALNQIGLALGTEDPHQTHLIVSLFFFGMAIGQLFYGPFADSKGRRAAVLSGVIIFAIGTVICLVANSLTMLLVGRVIQAFGVSGPRVATLALIRDQYQGNAMARVMSFIMMVFILVPMIAPIIGQTVLTFFNWRHIFSLFLVITLFIGIWFYQRQPETLPIERRKPFSWKQLVISSKYILTHIQVMGYTLAMGMIFGAFLAYLSTSQTIFQTIYQTGNLFPAYFALLAFSVGFASFANGILVVRHGMKKLSNWALVGLLIFSALLLCLTVNQNGVPPLWQLVSLLFPMFFCVGILFGNLNSMAMQPLGEMAGLGAAIIGSLSSLMSVPIAIFIGDYISHSITPVVIGFIVFGGLSLLFVSIANRQAD